MTPAQSSLIGTIIVTVLGLVIMATLLAMLWGCVPIEQVEPAVTRATQEIGPVVADAVETVVEQSGLANVGGDVAALHRRLDQSAGRDVNNPWPYVVIIGLGVFGIVLNRVWAGRQYRKNRRESDR